MFKKILILACLIILTIFAYGINTYSTRMNTKNEDIDKLQAKLSKLEEENEYAKKESELFTRVIENSMNKLTDEPETLTSKEYLCTPQETGNAFIDAMVNNPNYTPGGPIKQEDLDKSREEQMLFEELSKDPLYQSFISFKAKQDEVLEKLNPPVEKKEVIDNCPKSFDISRRSLVSTGSGTEAGYNWAKEQEFESRNNYDCASNSDSFTNGCNLFIEDLQDYEKGLINRNDLEYSN